MKLPRRDATVTMIAAETFSIQAPLAPAQRATG